MQSSGNPALSHLVAEIGESLIFAQVLIRRVGSGYELRHMADAVLAPASLRLVKPHDVRSLAQYTSTGAFRPLKSAPNLQNGWRISAGGDVELGGVLDQLYPGAVADWHAATQDSPPVTNFREFAERQTGMYAVTAELGNERASEVVLACCAKNFCLKRRLWTVPGAAPDNVAAKSIIPCFEPCAILLELARKAAQIEREEPIQFRLPPADLATLHTVLQSTLAAPDLSVAEGNLGHPGNPRRVQLVLDRLEKLMAAAPLQRTPSAD